MYFSSIVALSLFHYVIKFVGVSAVTILVCLINVLDLHVVSIAKLYVIKNLNPEGDGLIEISNFMKGKNRRLTSLSSSVTSLPVLEIKYCVTNRIVTLITNND